MKLRKLGWTDLEFTVLGLGTWAIGGGDWAFSWGPQNDEDSTRAIRRAVQLGINWIDTAPAYGLGHAETVVGQALAGLSTRPWIATKCGRSWNERGQLVPNLKAPVVRAEVEASLRRLQVDVIDLYQMHWPQPPEDIEEAWGVMAEMVAQGKVRYLGVCNLNVAQMERLRPIHPIASLQPPYSMLLRDVEKELLPYCARHDIGVVPYSPMQKGLLTGKFTAERVGQLPADDHRRRDPMFQEPRLGQIQGVVAGLTQIASRHQRTTAELALAWVLRRPEITSAIVGTRRPEQIEQLIEAGNWTLSRMDLAAIDNLLKTPGD